MQPWIGPKPDGYILLLGQIPTDVSILAMKLKMKTDLRGIYK